MVSPQFFINQCHVTIIELVGALFYYCWIWISRSNSLFDAHIYSAAAFRQPDISELGE